MGNIEDSARQWGRSSATRQTDSRARKRVMKCLTAAVVIAGLAACDDDTSPSKSASTSEPVADSQASVKTGSTEPSVNADRTSVPIDTLRDYRNQTVQWAACDSTILGRNGGEND